MIRSGVFVVETVDVGHEEQVVGLDHCCCYSREGVVVAKFDFLTPSVCELGDVWTLLTDTARVSFSLTIGMTPMLNNSTNVFCALMYCVRCILVNMTSTPPSYIETTHVGDIVPCKQDLGDRLPQMAKQAVP